MKKANKIFASLEKRIADKCPKCKSHFNTGRIKPIWKDAVECLHCGHMWILRDFKEFKKWTSF